jgi:hypothetical protein
MQLNGLVEATLLLKRELILLRNTRQKIIALCVRVHFVLSFRPCIRARETVSPLVESGRPVVTHASIP